MVSCMRILMNEWIQKVGIPIVCINGICDHEHYCK